jgi:hypothetical protein
LERDLQHARVIRCEADLPDGTVRYLSDRIELSEGQARSVETLTRVVRFSDPVYGEVDLNREKLASMVKNFGAGVYGQKIFVDVAHKATDGAAGEIIRLFQERDKLRAEINWTDFGLDAVRKRGFSYLSAEYHEDYKDPETGKAHGTTLLGAGLTTRPRVKHLDPVSLKLSFDATEDDGPIIISPRVQRLLSEEITTMWKTLSQDLKSKLLAIGLVQAIVMQLCEAYDKAVEPFTDEAQAKLLMEQFFATGKQLHKELQESGANPTAIKLDIRMPDGGIGKTLSEDDVKRLLAEQRETDAKASKQLQESRDANVTLFTETLDAAAGLKALAEEQRAALLGARELITADMTAEQVKKLAEHQITLGNQMAVQAQLAARGWGGPAGSLHMAIGSDNSIKALQETVDRRLGLLDMPESRRFGRTGGKLLAENKALADLVLAQYDSYHMADLQKEHKLLAGGDGIVSDVAVPSSFERTVIREALYQMNGLSLVDTGVLAFASSHLIPYSYRDPTAAGRNSTRRYEGQAINRAGVIQTSETAYPIPQKLSFEVSDELRYLTSNGQLSWETVAENQRNASQIIAEDGEQLIYNEILQASDWFGSVAVVAEDLELQADDTKRVFVLTHFPVAHPRKVYDLQGNQVGATSNPITVTYNAVARAEYDGSGTQAAGTYYVLDYNHGEIYLVNQAGAIQMPANGTAYSISYSYASNAYAFDTDEGASEIAVHWDTFLYRYGLRKAVIEDARYHMANMGLMSGTAMTQIEQARKFAANYRVPGSDLIADGNLGRIKDVPNFKTVAPGLWMGDQRIVIGERGTTRWRMLKPWTIGDLENQKDANGRFTGKKEAYGDQFIILHTPTQLKNAYTSMVLYSAAARVARVNP